MSDNDNKPRYDKRSRRWKYECQQPACLFAISTAAHREGEAQGLIDFHDSHAHRPRKPRKVVNP